MAKRGRESYEGTPKERRQVQTRMLLTTIDKIKGKDHYGHNGMSSFINEAVDEKIERHEKDEK